VDPPDAWYDLCGIPPAEATVTVTVTVTPTVTPTSTSVSTPPPTSTSAVSGPIHPVGLGGKCWDVQDGVFVDGRRVQLWDCAGSVQ
jgi:hypothetical protein